MAVPKRKHSNHRTGIRRSHDGKSPIQLSICPECRQAVPTHV
ncbi:MAG: 50S ribosomal protein L32, partial [Thermoguttaceae bacterium]|nr:50S ribosomal protein L32 [Thermoguttaceae bacterium]